MDNNNINQQPVYQQATGQQMYQPQMPQQPKQPSKLNVTELIALICAGVGALMTILGVAFTCSCSASKTFDVEALREDVIDYSMSLIWILTLCGVILAVLGIVFGIIALKKKDAPVKAGKMSYVAIVVGVAAALYGVIPTLTICGYNCSLEGAMESLYGEEEGNTVHCSICGENKPGDTYSILGVDVDMCDDCYGK